jgi:hypothetical protein
VLRRSSWTPFDRPRDLDDEVYLVADDPRKFGRVWREAECETTDREPTSWVVSTVLLIGWCASTLRKHGRRMPRLSWPPSCAGAAICNFAEPPACLRGFLDRYDPIERQPLPLPLRLIWQ